MNYRVSGDFFPVTLSVKKVANTTEMGYDLVHIIINKEFFLKKTGLIFILSMLSFSLFAQKEFILQGMYMDAGRNYTIGMADKEYDSTSYGVNILTFSPLVGGVGLFSTASFLLPQTFTSSEGGSKSDLMPQYNDWQIALDALIGPAVNIPLGFPELLIGGGLHFNGYAFFPQNLLAYDPLLSYTLGAGVSGTVKFKFTEFFNLNISVMGGYDFMEIVHRPETSSNENFKTGLTTWGLSAGIGFKY